MCVYRPIRSRVVISDKIRNALRGYPRTIREPLRNIGLKTPVRSMLWNPTTSRTRKKKTAIVPKNTDRRNPITAVAMMSLMAAGAARPTPIIENVNALSR